MRHTAPQPLQSPFMTASLTLFPLLLDAFVLGGTPEFTIQTSPGPGWL